MVLFVRAAERFFSGVPQPPPPWRPSPESAKAEDHMLRMRIASALRSQHQLNGWLLIVLGFVSAGHSVAAATYTTPRAMTIGDVYELRRDGWTNPPGVPAYEGDVLPKTDANDGAGRDIRIFNGTTWPVPGRPISVIGSQAPISTRGSRTITLLHSRFSVLAAT